MGFNLCPPFLLAASFALGFADIAKSILFFFYFFLATSVFLIPLIFSGFVSRFQWVRLVGRVFSVFVGVWFIYIALKELLL